MSVKRLEAAVAILRKEALVRTISRDGNFIVMHFAGGIKDEAALFKKTYRKQCQGILIMPWAEQSGKSVRA